MTRSYRHWSRDEVVREIRRLAAQGSDLNSGYIARHASALAYAARKYLGSWENAIAAAGLDYSHIRRKNSWDRSSIVGKIRELAEAGERINISAAEKTHGGLVSAAMAHFGSWRQAITAAGLDYSRIKRQKEWSKKKVVSEMRRAYRQGMRLGTTIEVRQKYRTLHAAAVRYFGSWVEALRAARLGRLVRR
ncbi:MAG: hypothetical protein ABIL25_05200 [candidate division WOR-3 bacterium]